MRLARQIDAIRRKNRANMHQHRNKQLALEILQSRLAERQRLELHQHQSRLKSDQLGFAHRSGKIRTYNFINRVVTDHRTGCKTHRIEEVMKGHFSLIKN